MAVRSLAQSSLVEPFSNSSMLAGYESNYFHHLETVRLSSSASTVEFSNLARYSDFQHLQLRVVARKSTADTTGSVNSRINGATSGYSQHALRGTGSSVNSFGESNTIAGFNFYISAANATANIFGAGVIDILDPFDTNKNTTVRSFGGGAPSNQIVLASFGYYSTQIVNTYSLEALEGGFVAGSRFSLYGLKVQS